MRRSICQPILGLILPWCGAKGCWYVEGVWNLEPPCGVWAPGPPGCSEANALKGVYLPPGATALDLEMVGWEASFCTWKMKKKRIIFHLFFSVEFSSFQSNKTCLELLQPPPSDFSSMALLREPTGVKSISSSSSITTSIVKFFYSHYNLWNVHNFT